jgi:hypothetical protein
MSYAPQGVKRLDDDDTRLEAELGTRHFRTVPLFAAFNVIGRNGC